VEGTDWSTTRSYVELPCGVLAIVPRRSLTCKEKGLNRKTHDINLHALYGYGHVWNFGTSHSDERREGSARVQTGGVSSPQYNTESLNRRVGGGGSG